MSARTIRLGIMLSSKAGYLCLIETDTVRNLGRVSRVRLNWPASEASSGVNTSLISLISNLEGVLVKPEGSASSASASRS